MTGRLFPGSYCMHGLLLNIEMMSQIQSNLFIMDTESQFCAVAFKLYAFFNK